jgi:hypothetical protein
MWRNRDEILSVPEDRVSLKMYHKQHDESQRYTGKRMACTRHQTRDIKCAQLVPLRRATLNFSMELCKVRMASELKK